MAYSEPDDLLLGDLVVPATIDKGKVVASAAEEIDSKLGFVYALPLRFQTDPPPDPDDWTGLPIHQQLLLKQMNNKLASGRLILMLDLAGEDTSLHAYGLRLVTEATNEMMMIANGTVDLDAVRLAPLDSHPDRAPVVSNHDEESAVEMFEYATMRPGETGSWQPGKAMTQAGAVGMYYGFPD